jgi:UDP-GlcNAc:undecaprenyl-phosphate/decaprenyl-phosphate GlcNAc-1-phosphate transferase
VALIVAFVVTAVAAPIAARVGRRFGLVDRPGLLKVQDRPVPYLGGLAVFAGVVPAMAVERPVLIVPLGLSLALGLADDIKGPPPATRLGLAAVIGVIAAWVLPARDLPGALVTVVLVIGLLNAVNLLDGLDGLASGVCLVSAVGFALVLDDEFYVLALALAGSLAGFLVWNRPSARIYLGDGGSYLVGSALALLLAASFNEGESTAVASAGVLFLAVPVADMAVAVVRRLRARRPLLYGDRGHIYDQLVGRGWGLLAIIGAFTFAQGVLVGVGVAIAGLPAGVAVAVASTLLAFTGVVLFVAFTKPGTWKTR